ncbi:hypothetical protein HU200_052556 [Digitaria exilis]|uniref:Major facilitator superfamily (MFS) profile domain-containing protein n=1 Tax=Digitaria exilis TaxID=1010633 RepID=A0A835E780_9POAL|nr:hypothetical protein HU200_052556 [Digitaria exilis]
MAGGSMVAPAAGGRQDYPGGLTLFVSMACLVAATGGLLFGYDIGVSGGVTSMDSFLVRFFPSCMFDSQLLTTFTSSIFLSALAASLLAATFTRVAGRKWSMFGGGATFLAGCALNGAAENVLMLILGRVLLGLGRAAVPVGDGARMRGMLNNGFNLMITVGILLATLVNYGTQKISGGWGWRLSLALAAVPATVIVVGSFFLHDTPNSLLERGRPEEAKRMLRRVRGVEDVDEEYNDLVEASAASKAVTHPWRDILRRRYRPQLVMAVAIPMCQQLTGIVLQTYVFKTTGFGGSASLMSAVITGLVNLLATFVSVFTVDRLGRRALLLEGGLQMLLSMVVMGALMGSTLGFSGTAAMPAAYAAATVVVMCVYIAGFSWSWGPLGWLVPSEVMPLEARPAGQSITMAVNMLMNFVVAQAFLPLFCRLKFALFFVFAGLLAAMTLFVALFLPETKGKAHWYWKRFVTDGEDGGGGLIDTEKGHG